MSPTAGRGAPAKRRGRPVASTGEATRRLVLDAARQEFAERGYAAATMRSIASAAGVAPMILYNYARSKAALFSAVWDQSLEEIFRDYDETLVGRGSLIEELDAVIDRSRGVLLEAPEHVRLVLRILLDRTHPELVGANLQPPSAVDFYTRLVERGVSRGEHPAARLVEPSGPEQSQAFAFGCGFDPERRHRSECSCVTSDNHSQIALRIEGFGAGHEPVVVERRTRAERGEVLPSIAKRLQTPQ